MWAWSRRVWRLRERLPALLGGRQAALLPVGARGVHSSPVPCGKNLLKKFASKTKKKFWYEGPSLGSHLMYKPSQLEFLTKSTSRKTRKEDQVRLRALNGLLYKALTDLLCTPEVSQEVCDLNVQLSKVSLTSDFSACRVYWRTTLSVEQNAHAEAVLRRSAAHMRLIGYWQMRILGPQRKKKTVCKVMPGAVEPWTPLHHAARRALPLAPVCVGSIMRRSTNRSWSTRGEESEGAGARAAQSLHGRTLKRETWQLDPMQMLTSPAGTTWTLTRMALGVQARWR
ncbi:putative ribosome-binding factor A, mitochondrial isoform X2 [Suricata suricatta]|uniref:putative ribosome-binding factor A, mitochondrial isoform X2 n=1 Tax=Suricata suricatta TaxID=37032 RepID=UPI0011567F78|nr:putative ribosome-binding factor A, mitochondrial isoform X2 [Suricata suricatta]